MRTSHRCSPATVIVFVNECNYFVIVGGRRGDARGNLRRDWHPHPPHGGGGGGGGACDVSGNAVRLVSIRGSELLSDCGSHTDAARELWRAFEGAASWVASSRMIDGGGRHRRCWADGVEEDEDGECGDGGTGGPPGMRASHRCSPTAVIVFVNECNYFVIVGGCRGNARGNLRWDGGWRGCQI